MPLRLFVAVSLSPDLEFALPDDAVPSRLSRREDGTDIERVPVFGLGCAGGVSGLSIAARLAQARPGTVVLMVAIDEASAVRLPRDQIPDWTTRGDRQLFTKVDDENDLLGDVAELEKRLQADKVSYRIFSTDVVIRGSKWSKDPKN